MIYYTRIPGRHAVRAAGDAEFSSDKISSFAAQLKARRFACSVAHDTCGFAEVVLAVAYSSLEHSSGMQDRVPCPLESTNLSLEAFFRGFRAVPVQVIATFQYSPGYTSTYICDIFPRQQHGKVSHQKCRQDD